MTYARLGHEWWFDLRPLCASPCHKIVTAVSRALRPQVSLAGSTYLVWFVARLPVLAIAGLTADVLR